MRLPLSLWTVVQRFKLFVQMTLIGSSLEGLPQDAINNAKELNAHFSTFVRDYKNGVAEVSWQINPDGRYYMDEDGYGMTDDEEITIYSYVDRTGKPLVRFRNIRDYGELDEMEKEARRTFKNIKQYEQGVPRLSGRC